MFRKLSKRELFFYLTVMVIILGFNAYYIFFFTPKNSLELYQAIHFVDDFHEAKKVMLKGYEDHFQEEDFVFLSKLEETPERISQFTLFEYKDKTYMLMTTPGTTKLEVLQVEQLPEEIRQYFLGISHE